MNNKYLWENLNNKSSSHPVYYQYLCEKEMFQMSYTVSDQFLPRISNSSELEMISFLISNEQTKDIGSFPYIAIIESELIQLYVDDFLSKTKNDSIFKVTNNKFLFKAKVQYYNDIIYFYAFERKDSFKGYAGFSLVYPNTILGTEYENILIEEFDNVSETFKQEKCSNQEHRLIHSFPIVSRFDENNKTITSLKSIDLRSSYYKDYNRLYSRIVKDASILYLVDNVNIGNQKRIKYHTDFEEKILKIIIPNVSITKTQMNQIQTAKNYLKDEYDIILKITATNY